VLLSGNLQEHKCQCLLPSKKHNSLWRVLRTNDIHAPPDHSVIIGHHFDRVVVAHVRTQLAQTVVDSVACDRLLTSTAILKAFGIFVDNTGVVHKPIVETLAPTIRHVGVNVAVVAVVMSIEIALETILRVWEEILISLVVSRTVIGVNGLLTGVKREEEVVADVAPGWDDTRLLWIGDISDVRDAVPAVVGPVIATLAHSVRDHVVLNDVSASEAIVEVHAGSGHVEVHVSHNMRLRSDSLEPHAALPLPKTKLAHQIARDCGEARLLSVPSIRTHRPIQLLGAILVQALASGAPCSENVVAVPRDLVVADCAIAIIVAEEDPVSIKVCDSRVTPAGVPVVPGMKSCAKAPCARRRHHGA